MGCAEWDSADPERGEPGQLLPSIEEPLAAELWLYEPLGGICQRRS